MANPAAKNRFFHFRHAVASYHLLLNCSYLSWQLAEAGKMEKLTTVNPYSRPFFIVCNGALVCGPVSFILAIYQLIIFK